MGCGNAAPGTTQAERRPDASGTGATRLAGALVEATAAAALRHKRVGQGLAQGREAVTRAAATSMAGVSTSCWPPVRRLIRELGLPKGLLEAACRGG